MQSHNRRNLLHINSSAANRHSNFYQKGFWCINRRRTTLSYRSDREWVRVTDAFAQQIKAYCLPPGASCAV